MKTINETVVLLFYRRPDYRDREFICACESDEVANEEIHRLREEWPHAYPTPERFETNLLRYVRRAY